LAAFRATKEEITAMPHQARRTLFVAVLVLLGIGTAAAQESGKHYLALGDSIPFGYNPSIPLTTPDLLSFYHGYPQFVSESAPLDLANASCPGETSSSFLDVAAPDNGCHEWRSALPLFVGYNSPFESQLKYAISFLRANPHTSLVTITVGGDDLLLLEQKCVAQSIDPAVIESCELAGLPKVLATFARNLTAIYLAIRIEGHYEGRIVAADYFSPDYGNALETGSLIKLNAITLGLTAVFGGRVADVFSAFQTASLAGGGLPCAAGVGLAFPNFSGGCDVHPTPLGQQLIAKLVLEARE
jgi:GDSL-like Lipase/Acylhydrolase family